MSFKDEYEKRSKKDFIDRKISYIERIFDKLFYSVSKDPKTTIIVLCLMTIGFLAVNNNNLRDKIVENQGVSYDRMLDIINQQVDYKVDRKVRIETRKLENKVENSTKKVDSTTKNVDDMYRLFKDFLQSEMK